ncbi:MAG TPA: NADH-quinone oxidoreductase subunit H [bacterium]|nr:NADH-quinone oxidoreductase subunit H [bacterium]
MNPILLTTIQTAVILSLAPLSVGLTRFFKARFQGRHGAAPWLPYITYATMLKKETIVSASSSWMFRVAPYMVLGSSVFMALVLPLVTSGGVLANFSNFLLVAAVLALGSAFLVMAGLDVGSAFGGMGASREMTIASLLEATIILTFAAFALATGTSTIDGMLASASNVSIMIASAPYLCLSLVALILISLAENARYPVDNPATHLELTMVHEAMILDYSGPYLAMMEYASTLKLTVFALLVANFVMPWPLMTTASTGSSVLLALFMTLVKLVVVLFAVALLESTIAKMRFYRVQEFLTGAFFMALTGLALALLSQLL